MVPGGGASSDSPGHYKVDTPPLFRQQEDNKAVGPGKFIINCHLQHHNAEWTLFHSSSIYCRYNFVIDEQQFFHTCVLTIKIYIIEIQIT